MSKELILTEKQNNAFPTPQEFATMKELGKIALDSGFLPAAINTPAKAIVIMLKGRELGLAPMHAFSSISVIQGKPSLSAELMITLIYRNVPGAVVDFIETDNTKCVIEAQRPNGKRTTFTFTMKDAETAKLTGKGGSWLTYPAAMLRARCISSMARAMFADALSGIVYTPEELGAQVDEEGEIIEVHPEPAQKKTALESIKEAVKPMPHQHHLPPTMEQLNKLYASAEANRVSPEQVISYMKNSFGKKSTKDLDYPEYCATLKWISEVNSPEKDFEPLPFEPEYENEGA